MSKSLQSPVFGRLQVDDESPELPIYSAELVVPVHGAVTVSLVALNDDEPDWRSLLRAAERQAGLDALLERRRARRVVEIGRAHV